MRTTYPERFGVRYLRLRKARLEARQRDRAVAQDVRRSAADAAAGHSRAASSAATNHGDQDAAVGPATVDEDPAR